MTDSSTTLTRLAPTQVALELSVGDDELAAAEERAYRDLVKNVRLPGFRKGHVPRKLFEQTYGVEALRSRAVEDVVPEIYARAVREYQLQPVDSPRLEVLEERAGHPRRLKATVEVRPEIELGPYKGLVVRQTAIVVGDAQVEASLAALARERATLAPVSRAARMGDVATVDYTGTIDGVPFEGGEARGQSLDLQEGRFIPGFVGGILGMRPGEHRSIEVRFPDEYSAAELAGKAASFAVTLHDLKEIELPPLDDAFARGISGAQSLAELRAALRRRLESLAATRTRQAIGDEILQRLIAAHDIPLPPSLVEAEIDRLIEEDGPPAGGAEPEAQARDARRPEAESRVKSALLLEQIAKREKIVATPADVVAELEVLGRRYGQPAARIRKALGKNLVSLMEGIVRSKTLDMLVEGATIVANQETPPSPS